MNETQTTTDFLLSVAREVIGLRAARDGYEPGAYDAERDPEDHIASLISALHKWCHRYGIDWERELATAQGFFEQDIAESQPGAPSLSQPDIKELRCPKCGQRDSFVIEVSEPLLMFADGVVLHGDTGEEWGDWSPCRCHSCQQIGTVYQFRKADKKGGCHEQ